jgi:hypothetical protein
MDINLHFRQMCFVMASFGIAFRTHRAQFNSKTDAVFFRTDELLVTQINGVVNNVIALMQIDIESQMKGKLLPVSE